MTSFMGGWARASTAGMAGRTCALPVCRAQHREYIENRWQSQVLEIDRRAGAGAVECSAVERAPQAVGRAAGVDGNGEGAGLARRRAPRPQGRRPGCGPTVRHPSGMLSLALATASGSMPAGSFTSMASAWGDGHEIGEEPAPFQAAHVAEAVRREPGVSGAVAGAAPPAGHAGPARDLEGAALPDNS
jgi:hypothetical protein